MNESRLGLRRNSSRVGLRQRRLTRCIALLTIGITLLLELTVEFVANFENSGGSTTASSPCFAVPRVSEHAVHKAGAGCFGGQLVNGRERTPPSQALPGALVSAWSATGIGPMASGVWSTLAPYPPFSLVNWAALKIMGLPSFWRVYMMWSLGNTFLQWIVPGLYAQILTGTWLGLLSVVYPPAYTRSIIQRLQQLLQKQANLQRVPGQMAPRLSQETLLAVETQLKDDAILCQALGSVSVLGMWHKMEKTRLDDKKLLESVPADSQARWVLESLNAGYMGELEASGASMRLAKAADEAATSLKKLTDVVDTAAFRARHGAVEAGSSAVKSLAEVETASGEAAKAMAALEEARQKSGTHAQLISDPAARAAWSSKLGELIGEHAGAPAVAAELFKLKAVAEAAPAAT